MSYFRLSIHLVHFTVAQKRGREFRCSVRSPFLERLEYMGKYGVVNTVRLRELISSLITVGRAWHEARYGKVQYQLLVHRAQYLCVLYYILLMSLKAKGSGQLKVLR